MSQTIQSNSIDVRGYLNFSESIQIARTGIDIISEIFSKYLRCLTPLFGMTESRLESTKQEAGAKLLEIVDSLSSASQGEIHILMRIAEKESHYSFDPRTTTKEATVMKVTQYFQDELKVNPFATTYSFTAISAERRFDVIKYDFRIYKGKNYGIFYSNHTSYAKCYQFNPADLNSTENMLANYRMMRQGELELLL